MTITDPALEDIKAELRERLTTFVHCYDEATRCVPNAYPIYNGDFEFKDDSEAIDHLGACIGRGSRLAPASFAMSGPIPNTPFELVEASRLLIHSIARLHRAVDPGADTSYEMMPFDHIVYPFTPIDELKKVLWFIGCLPPPGFDTPTVAVYDASTGVVYDSTDEVLPEGHTRMMYQRWHADNMRIAAMLQSVLLAGAHGLEPALNILNGFDEPVVKVASRIEIADFIERGGRELEESVARNAVAAMRVLVESVREDATAPVNVDDSYTGADALDSSYVDDPMSVAILDVDGHVVARVRSSRRFDF